MAIQQSYQVKGTPAEHTVTNTVYTFPTKPTGANALVITCAAGDIRFTEDGSAPTTTHGERYLHDKEALVIPLQWNSVIKAIREASTDAPVQYKFVKLQNRW